MRCLKATTIPKLAREERREDSSATRRVIALLTQLPSGRPKQSPPVLNSCPGNPETITIVGRHGGKRMPIAECLLVDWDLQQSKYVVRETLNKFGAWGSHKTKQEHPDLSIRVHCCLPNGVAV